LGKQPSRATLLAKLAPFIFESTPLRQEDNLCIGRTVVADCVNPISITRAAWRQIAELVGVQSLEVEVRCSNLAEHRRRVENRTPDIPGVVPPTWGQVLSREYDPWDRRHIDVDTANQKPEEIVRFLRRLVEADAQTLPSWSVILITRLSDSLCLP
jgi:predicted kinase